MSNRKQIINIYIESFPSYLRVKRITDPSFYPTEDSIFEHIARTEKLYSEDINDIYLNDDERLDVIRSIESIYAIFQPEGVALLGDYSHDYTWYDNLLSSKEYTEYYWPRYKEYLTNNKHFSPNIVDRLENTTLRSLMSYLGNPNDESEFAFRGLVVGDVQSGKTSNYLGLINKAADAGYKVIFVLTGTIESLRKQTQQRIEEGFVGFDSANGFDVGVGRGDKTPKAFTSRARDFTAGDNQNTTYKISDYSAEPMIFVIKKNVSVLRKVYSALKKINTTEVSPRINYSMLMIDDEADNASVNTNKANNDPTKINEYIRRILSLFTRTSYVGFTATPFANVFISYDTVDDMLGNDLFPRDFIYALYPPTNYCGSKHYFFEKNENVVYIKDENSDIFSLDHKKDWQGSRLFDSVYHSINTFLIANAIRDIRGDINEHRSMLINMSRFTKVQGVIKDIVDDYFSHVRQAVKQTYRLNRKYALTNDYIQSLRKSFESEYESVLNDKDVTWDKVFDRLYEAIKDIKIVVVNSSKNSEKLVYDNYKQGLRVIAIGGLALSRGLTLEGLMCSYFYRNTATFDVLMQMGRWFGYREGYGDLCRIFMRSKSAEYYKEICEDIDCLKNDIKTMCSQNKKPKDYGIRVRNQSIELKITASNKMRNVKTKIILKSYFGNIFETPYLYRDLSISESNIDETKAFLSRININTRDYSVMHPYFRNIAKELIIDLLEKIKIHPANDNVFDLHQIIPFIKKNDSELNSFDVLILGGSGGKDGSRIFEFSPLDIDIKRVARRFDVHSKGPEEVIRINGVRAHLWGRYDTKFGLSDEQIRFIEEKNSSTKAQSYLDLTGSQFNPRNPLLIIYFVDLTMDDDEDDYIPRDEQQKILSCYMELNNPNKKNNFVVGYAIGFPNVDGADTSAESYAVNITANYFDNEHSYEGDDENE